MERMVLVIDQDRRLFSVMLQALRDVDFVGHLVVGECGLSKVHQYGPSLVVVSDHCLGLDPRQRLLQFITEVPAPFLVLCSMRDGVSEHEGAHLDASAALALGALDSIYRGDAVELIRARLRRACQLARALYPAPGLMSLVGDVQLHVPRRQLISAAGVQQLGHLEARIVAALARAQGERISRSELFAIAWRDELEPNDRRLDVRVSAINHKLAHLTSGRARIACIRNLGYCLSEDPTVVSQSSPSWHRTRPDTRLSRWAISAV